VNRRGRVERFDATVNDRHAMTHPVVVRILPFDVGRHVAGAAWTDWRGRAVRPLSQPYGFATRAAVTVMPMPALAPREPQATPLPHAIEPARRIVLFATFPDGTPVPRGTPVLDAHRTQVAVVAEAGQVFLTHDIVDAQLGVPLPGGGIGLLAFTIPAQPAPGVHYERIPATCRPLRRQRSAWTIGAHAGGH
jgi:outer membrane usher protein FimD/PapC